MTHRIQETFDQIHATQALRDKTKASVARKTRGYRRARFSAHRLLVPMAACLLFVLIGLGSYWTFLMPTSTISIDINPSLELGINRFDQVVSVKGYNDDGQALAETLHIRFLSYAEALEQILSSDSIVQALSRDEIMTIAVVGSDDTQSQRLCDGISSCTAEEENTYCYATTPEAVSHAHAQGLSYGKYHALLELQELDPSITAEDIQSMTMRQIRDLLESLSPDGAEQATDDCVDQTYQTEQTDCDDLEAQGNGQQNHGQTQDHAQTQNNDEEENHSQAHNGWEEETGSHGAGQRRHD